MKGERKMNLKRISILVVLVLLVSTFLTSGVVKGYSSGYSYLPGIKTTLALEDTDVDFVLSEEATATYATQNGEALLTGGKVIYDTWNGIKAKDGYDFGATFYASVDVDSSYTEDTILLNITVPVSEGYTPGLTIIELNEKTYEAYGTSNGGAFFNGIPFEKSSTQEGKYTFIGFINFKHIVEFEAKKIDTIILKNVNLTLVDGKLPTFSGESAEPDLYTLKGDCYEMWTDVDTKEYYTSAAFYNRDNVFEKLVAGHKYSYSVQIFNISPQKDDRLASDFSTVNKISVNGTTYNLTSDNISYDPEWGWAINIDNILTVTATSEKTEETPVTPPPAQKNYVNKISGIVPGVYLQDSSVDFKIAEGATATIETSEKVLEKATVIYDNWEISGTSNDYDFVVTVCLDAWLDSSYTSNTINATVTLPIPVGYSEALTKIVLNEKEYTPISVSNGYAVFELPFTNNSWDYAFTAIGYFKKANTVTLTTNSSSTVQNVIVTIKNVDADSIQVKPVEISETLKNAEKNLKKVFDITALKNGNVVAVSDTEVKVEMPLDEDLKGYNTYKVVYIENNKIVETLPATVKDGKISFTTSHLSEYGIVAYNENTSPKTGDNVMVYTTMLILATLGISIVIAKKLRK